MMTCNNVSILRNTFQILVRHSYAIFSNLHEEHLFVFSTQKEHIALSIKSDDLGL